MQLQPREYFPIYRQLSDHTDTNTYYVQAKIYNAKTETLLQTINLTNNGTGNFSYNWQTPADTSGQGLYIKIITSVYSDSGYTTKASLYGDQGDLYLVQDRFANLGGGGAYIDYPKIEKMIKKELENLPKPEPVKETNLNPIMDRLNNLEMSLGGIEMPEIKETDLQPILNAIKEVKEAVNEIVIPEPEKIDLKPLEDKINKIDLTKTEKSTTELLDRIRDYFDKDMNKLEKFYKDILNKIGSIPIITTLGSQTKEEESQPVKKMFKR